ncbi:MAG: hypothetical protein KA715_14775 [Xanthomonadaceae bacterium]|nr:hypothetical protein [Xanthomonadaceae bacterium]
MKNWSPLALSVLLHALLLGIYFLSLLEIPHQQNNPSHEIELIAIESPIKKVGQGTSARGSLQSIKNLSSFASDFFLKGSSQAAPEHGQTNTSGFKEFGDYSLTQDSQLHPFIKSLYENINNRTHYPQSLASQRIAGNVRLLFEVNEQGVFNGNLESLSTDQPLLQTYTVAALIAALRNPLPQNLWAKEKRTYRLALQVDYRILVSGDMIPEPSVKIAPNELFIAKYNFQEPLINQKINELFERIIPPVIVLPGFVYVDFYRLYRFIEERGKPDRETKTIRRMEADIETWNKFIKESTSTSSS